MDRRSLIIKLVGRPLWLLVKGEAGEDVVLRVHCVARRDEKLANPLRAAEIRDYCVDWVI